MVNRSNSTSKIVKAPFLSRQADEWKHMLLFQSFHNASSQSNISKTSTNLFQKRVAGSFKTWHCKEKKKNNNQRKNKRKNNNKNKIFVRIKMISKAISISLVGYLVTSTTNALCGSETEAEICEKPTLIYSRRNETYYKQEKPHLNQICIEKHASVENP